MYFPGSTRSARVAPSALERPVRSHWGRTRRAGSTMRVSMAATAPRVMGSLGRKEPEASLPAATPFR